MDSAPDPVIFEAHPSSATLRRVVRWLVPALLLPMGALFLSSASPALGWILVGTIPVVAIVVMPWFAPLRVELAEDEMRFGSGVGARRIAYDRVLVVDLRRSNPEPESDDDADEPAPGPDPTSVAALRAADVWRVTVHASIVPVSIGLIPDDARSLAAALHQMCPRAALWDVDGRLIEPIDSALVAQSIARVRRMAVTRRVFSMIGGVLSFGAFTTTLGGGSAGLGLLGQILPYFWMGLGAGLFGLAAGAEKSLRTTDEGQPVDDA